MSRVILLNAVYISAAPPTLPVLHECSAEAELQPVVAAGPWRTERAHAKLDGTSHLGQSIFAYTAAQCVTQSEKSLKPYEK